MSNTLSEYKSTLLDYIKANAVKIGVDSNNVELFSSFAAGEYNSACILIRSMPIADADFLSTAGVPGYCSYSVQCLCINSAASDEAQQQESEALNLAGRLATLLKEAPRTKRFAFQNPPLFTFKADSTIGIVSVNLVASVDIFRPLLEVPNE